MIVYMALNLITEKVYIGATKKTLAERIKDHHGKVRSGGRTQFHIAMRAWSTVYWEFVELQQCDSLQELDRAEIQWIERCDARNPNVGYNSYDGRYLTGARGAATMQKKVVTEQERERLREIGRKGALSKKRKRNRSK